MISLPESANRLNRLLASLPLPLRVSMPALGRLLLHFSLPVFLSTARKLGASGLGTLLCPSSTPLLVSRNTVSPTTRGEQVERLWGNTPSWPIMSSRQTISASVSL